MALQSSGAISLNDIQNEFGGSNPIGINEYYGVAPGIPASGQIAIGDFYGASAITPASSPFTLELLVIAGGATAQADDEGGGYPGGGGAGGMYFVTIPGASPGLTIPITVGSQNNPTVTPYVTVTAGGRADASPIGNAIANTGGSGAGGGYNDPRSGGVSGAAGNTPPLSPAQGRPGFQRQINGGDPTWVQGGGGGGYVSGGPTTTAQNTGGTGYVLNNFVSENIVHGGSPVVPGHPMQVSYGGGGSNDIPGPAYPGPAGSPVHGASRSSAHGWPGWAAAPSPPGFLPQSVLNSNQDDAGFGWGGSGSFSSEGNEPWNEGGVGAIFIRYPGSNWPAFGGRIQNQDGNTIIGQPFNHPNGTEYFIHYTRAGATVATALKVANAPGPY